MRFFRTPSLLLPGVLAVLLPVARAQAPATAARTTPSASVRLKAADEAFRAGSAAYVKNDLRSAHAQFAKVVRLEPNVAAGHSAFGTVLLAEGDAKEAITQLEWARRLDPRDAVATLHLAMAYSQLQDYARSVKMFRLLDQIGSGGTETLTPEAAIAYATALAATTEVSEAQKALEAALRVIQHLILQKMTLGINLIILFFRQIFPTCNNTGAVLHFLQQI